MSQSDYIQRKRLGKELNVGNQTKFPHVLGATSYTHYKQYSLENTVQNTSKRYNQLLVPGSKSIFNMEVANSTVCPSFNMCPITNRIGHGVVDSIAFNPYVSGKAPYINSYTNVYTPQQLHFVKSKPTKCKRCIDKNASRGKPNENTWYKRHFSCDCAMSTT